MSWRLGCRHGRNDFRLFVESRLLRHVVAVAVREGDIVGDLLPLGCTRGRSDPIPGVLGVVDR